MGATNPNAVSITSKESCDVTRPYSKPARSYHHGDLRAALLASARVLLEESGPASLSVREIARRVGVAAPSVYHHFANLDALTLALVEQGFTEFAHQLKEAPTNAKGRMRETGTAYIRFACTNPNLYRLMFGEGFRLASNASGPIRQLRQLTYDKLSAGLSLRLPPEKVPDAALYLWSITHGLAMLIIDGQLGAEANVEDRIQAVLGLAGAGLPTSATSDPPHSGVRAQLPPKNRCST
ncbi:MAG: TetR/AcrR family transcriptional regulator [Thiomonas arsenitoxydans]|uniref:TetR/AcrR family transcriptional regulator n=1 Tax=Thiomonas arsenitoxydans (strain DSM 22701 / CIP 110005 / 3As) TaxID=426114 RepID=A0A8I1MW01_THIA3|nr:MULTISPECIES: TetR/AcrR family transcriptional regulator [Thiomonas]MBN8743057.1 TetR/AcrR family transcriptional regulator [Thiomonas arsenitoxydans]